MRAEALVTRAEGECSVHLRAFVRICPGRQVRREGQRASLGQPPLLSRITAYSSCEVGYGL